jgi:hypothetical protein
LGPLVLSGHRLPAQLAVFVKDVPGGDVYYCSTYNKAVRVGGGSEYAALLAHAGGALYGMELGSVTLKRIGFFCFPIKHSTHNIINRVCVVNMNTLSNIAGCVIVAAPVHAPSHAPLLLPLLLSHNIPPPRVH